jgi:hypothetical protein
MEGRRVSEQALIEERACSRSPELIKQPIKREKPLGVILDFSQRKPKKETKRPWPHNPKAIQREHIC